MSPAKNRFLTGIVIFFENSIEQLNLDSNPGLKLYFAPPILRN